MKNFTLFLCVITLLTGFLKPVKAQGWEIFVSRPEFATVYPIQVTPGANSGVRIVYESSSNNLVTSMINYNAVGEFANDDGVPGTEGWEFIKSDNTGGTYWRTGYSIRKLNADNQLEWVFGAPIVAGAYQFRPGPNGSIYTKYHMTNDGYVIDAINEDGILEHRFNFGNNNPDAYMPTGDFGLIYTDEIVFGPETWIKLDNQGNVAWVRDFTDDDRILGGSADGATYLRAPDNYLIKLDAAGHVEWSMDLESLITNSFLSIDSYVELSDGNVGISAQGFDFGSVDVTPTDFILIIKINAQTGDVIWSKRSIPIIEWTHLDKGFFEMPDGGLAVAASVQNPSESEQKLFIMRTDVYGNTVTNVISGRIYRDESGDCEWQDTEAPIGQTSIIAQSDSKVYSTTTDSLGRFSMTVRGGSYQISYGELGSYWAFCAAPLISLAPSNDTVIFNSGVSVLADCPELVVSVGSNVFRRCFDNNYLYIRYQNMGTVAAENAYVDLYMDPQLMFLASTPVSADQIGQAYRFALGTLDVGERGQIAVNFKVDCDAEMGSILCVDVQIHPDTACLSIEPLPSEDQFCLPVVASYDPNDKTAFVDGKPEYQTILPDQELEYLIRFQNTGNDTAFNVVIVDTLGIHLDAASVVPGASSHPYTFNLVNGHVLQFSFSNILLPDSTTNETGSHGFVKFWVRQSEHNIIGNRIKNSAAIYFDFNDPIITNETELQIVIPNSVRGPENQGFVRIFPMPAHDEAYVLFNNASVGAVLWRMFDTTGRMVAAGKSSESDNLRIHRNHLPSGLYYCQFLLETGQIVSGKIIFD